MYDKKKSDNDLPNISLANQCRPLFEIFLRKRVREYLRVRKAKLLGLLFSYMSLNLCFRFDPDSSEDKRHAIFICMFLFDCNRSFYPRALVSTEFAIFV